MALDFSDIPTARAAFRQLYNQVQSIFNWTLKGSRLQKVGNGVADDDAATLGQVNTAINTAIDAIKIPATSTDLTLNTLRIIKSITPTTDDTAKIGSGTLAFSDIYGYVLHIVTTAIFEGLTDSLPLKLDNLKLVKSEAINLASIEVSGTLPLGNGGTGGTTAPLARVSLNAGEAKTYTCLITTPLTGSISGAADLVTGAVTGTCTITAGVIQVTITP